MPPRSVLISRSLRIAVALFYCSFFLLFSSGRMSSLDALGQLKATVLLVRTGRLGAKNAPVSNANDWLKNDRGDYYERHDLGNIVLMLPAAWIGTRLTPGSVEDQVNTPPPVAGLAVALTMVLISAIGATFTFGTFACFYPPRTAVLLSLASVTTTFLWPYSKTAWDVLGCAVGVSALLYWSARLLTQRVAATSTVAGMAISFVAASTFRYSLSPFLAVGMALVVFFARRTVRWRDFLVGIAICAAGLAPTFIYNAVRTASPLETATTGHYGAISALTTPLRTGIYGLLVAPNRGLLEFAPVLLLTLVPIAIWRRLPRPAICLAGSYLVGSMLYVLVIAKLNNWDSFGWGPRYLVPILPVLFFTAGTAIVALWRRYKTPLQALLALSFALNAVPVLVNWHLATTEYPGAMNAMAPLPRQHMAVWNGLIRGLRGLPLPAGHEIASDPVHRMATQFPDLLAFHMIHYSPRTAIFGWALLTLLVTATIYFWRQVVRLTEPAPNLHASQQSN